MKRTLLVAIPIVMFTFQAQGDENPGYPIERTDRLLVNVFNNMNEIGSKFIKHHSVEFVRLVEIPDDTMILDLGYCAISSIVYLALSEMGEAPDQGLFEIGSFVDPKLDSISTTSAGGSSIVSVYFNYRPLVTDTTGNDNNSLGDPKQVQIEVLGLHKIRVLEK